MVTLITWEHENSQPEARAFESMAFAYTMAKNGGFYKAQVVIDGIVEYEFKA